MLREDLGRIFGLQERIAQNLRFQDIKDILALYRRGMSMREIAEKLFPQHEIGIGKGVVSHIIGDILAEEEKKHLKGRGARTQIKGGIGIHKQSPEEKQASGRAGALASGGVPYSEEELMELNTLRESPEYMLGTRINATKIANILNNKFHDNEDVRNSANVRKKVSRLKNEIRNNGDSPLPKEK